MKKFIIVAKAFIQNADDTILLLRRSASDTRRPLEWDIPGGMVENQEDYVSGAAREIQEESGLVVAEKDLNLAYTLTAMHGEGNVCWLFFIGKTLDNQITLSIEHDDYRWVSIAETMKQITHQGQLAALKHIRDYKLFG